MNYTIADLLNNIFSIDHAVLLVGFIFYELLYRTYVINKVKDFYMQKLESYKALNNNETEKLKHALNKLLTLQLQHRNEERQAMVNFLANCNQWIFNLSRIKFDDYSLRNIDDLKKKILNIQDDYFLSIYSERVKILLFITNEQVNISMHQLVAHVEKYKVDMETILAKLQQLLEEQFYSSYQEQTFLEEFGEGYLTLYGVDNTALIKDLSVDFEQFNCASFNGCMLQIELFASTAKNYLTSIEFNKL